MYAQDLIKDQQTNLNCNVFVDSRSRVLVATLDPQDGGQFACHVHASKQITVLDGYAEVDVDGALIKLFEGQSTYISNGQHHRITNPGRIPLKYVEIRKGPYLEDDDTLS